MKKVRVTVDGKKLLVPAGTTVGELLKRNPTGSRLPLLGAVIDNRLVDPDFTLLRNCSLRVLTYRDWEGLAIYRRSATLILIEAVHQVFPARRLSIGQSLADGYYFDLYLGRPLKKNDIRKIELKMREIVDQDRPFVKSYLSYQGAKTYYEKWKLADKLKLLESFRAPEIYVVSCGSFQEFYPGPTVPDTGRIESFALEPYDRGFVLRFPTWGKGYRLAPMRKDTKLFNVYRETLTLNEILSVENVGQLNELCVTGKIRELIVIAEALHAKKIAAIADEIARRGNKLKLVLIAGPSASGKTTFAKRLAIQLRVNGLDPVALSMDNYFKDREKTPRNEKGEYDFESLGSLDLMLFNRQLRQLIDGRTARTPIFDFKKGRREKTAFPIRLTPGRVLIVEGLHCLNDKVSAAVPARNKFLIHVSALTQLRLDDHNRIFTSDTRLLRRIVRDRIFRGWSAAATIRRWPMVRQSEKRNIFRFQENADFMFNSALVYEQAVLKDYAELALLDITPDRREYVETERLLHSLSYFAPISEEDVPPASILREFIGGSFFEY